MNLLPEHYAFTTSAPNGIIASCANFILCTPNGIPIMVMHQISPMLKETIAISQPHSIIQRIFTRKCPILLLYSMLLPNGYKTKPANFKHCIPRGTPIIVTKQRRAATNHKSDIIPPPNKSHNIFPIVFISQPQTKYSSSVSKQMQPSFPPKLAPQSMAI